MSARPGVRLPKPVAFVVLSVDPCDADQRRNYAVAHSSLPVRTRAERGLPAWFWRHALRGTVDSVALSDQFATRRLTEPGGFRCITYSIASERLLHSERCGYHCLAPERVSLRASTAPRNASSSVLGGLALGS
mmetsp:Transcript_1832/g.4500  ORF Transcript_1832/g.4500 Transcript_1832/m.4500 type:complete len:133 (+) Transcript_1832:255-653(+)